MDPVLPLHLPPGFDDSGADAQVHPVARRLVAGTSPSAAFSAAAHWLDELGDDASVVDVSWLHLAGEPEPYVLALYVTFPGADSGE